MLMGTALTAHAAPPDFWRTWGDGQAELNGYVLTQQRYGQTRVGRAVVIFVTETFSDSARVKADPGRHAKADEFAVLKTNINEHFQTGIYDYNLMTSVFARVDAGHGMAAGLPVKGAFSSQEWCGQVFEAWWAAADRDTRFTRHSYFDGEADQQGPLVSAGTWWADELFAAARGLSRPLPANGGTVVMVPRMKESRLLHHPTAAVTATVTRTPANVKVPAGTFAVEQVTLTRADGVVHIYQVERAAPHRLVAWEIVGQERAELTGTLRNAYWQHNRLGDEVLLNALGLKPR